MLVLFVLSISLTSLVTAEPEWWKTSILYQIYPRSFADSDGDGNGDIRGIINKIPYLSSLGIGVVWLSPIYDSPWDDMGYDISDYKSVHPKFGTLDDAKEMIKKFRQTGIRVFMDLVPNHSSDRHAWFNASRHGSGEERDFYVWKDPKSWNDGKPVPPNNWLSAFGGSAWEYDEFRKQYYLHQFGVHQVDLNYNNPKVVEAMKDVMRFWFDLGVDGFRVDTPHFIAEHPEFPDEPKLPNCESKNPYDCLDHIYTKNQPHTFEVLRDFQSVIQKEYYSDKYMILEAYAPWDIQKNYYGPLMSPFNFQPINDFWMDTNATKLNDIVTNYMENLPKGLWPNWVLGNHDNTRAATRLGAEMVDAINMFILLMPGTAITYNGEEIGMVDTHIRSDQILDCCNRDPQRTPMQWSKESNAGFSKSPGGSWLPVNPNYDTLNVESESSDKNSHIEVYKQLSQLRKDLVHSSSLDTSTIGDWIFCFSRTNHNKTYYVVINLNNIEEHAVLSNGFKDIPPRVMVKIASNNCGFTKGDTIDSTKNITLFPRSGVVLSLDVSTSSSVTSSLSVLLSALLVVFVRRS